MAFRPTNVLPAHLVHQLVKIQPSTDGRGRIYPCRLVLMDTQVIERAALVEEGHGLEGKGIQLEDIALIDESPWRISPALANNLYASGESGMGYTVFKLLLRDGRTVASYAGWRVDFPGLPDGVRGNDVVEVFPHLGREMYGTSAWIEPPRVETVHFVFPPPA